MTKPTNLSEIERLKFLLIREKKARLQTEAINLQMLQRQMAAQLNSVDAEAQTFFDALKTSYELEPGDEVGEDGSIKRAPRPSLEG